jgi:hypothetical protein
MRVRTRHSRLASRTSIATGRLTSVFGTSQAPPNRFGGASGPGPLLGDSRRRTLGHSLKTCSAIMPQLLREQRVRLISSYRNLRWP